MIGLLRSAWKITAGKVVLIVVFVLSMHNLASQYVDWRIRKAERERLEKLVSPYNSPESWGESMANVLDATGDWYKMLNTVERVWADNPDALKFVEDVKTRRIKEQIRRSYEQK